MAKSSGGTGRGGGGWTPAKGRAEFRAYVAAIRNPGKKRYALEYDRLYRSGKKDSDGNYKRYGLSYLAAQSVRTNVRAHHGEPYARHIVFDQD